MNSTFNFLSASDKHNIYPISFKVNKSLTDNINSNIKLLFESVLLLEKNHVLETFESFVDDIIIKIDNNIKSGYFNQNKTLSLYTGWSFDIDNQICIECSRDEYEKNNNLYGLYLFIYLNKNKKNESASVQLRNINEDNNFIIIKINLEGYNTKKYSLYSVIHHELLHINHQYKKKDRNIIFNKKNIYLPVNDDFDLLIENKNKYEIYLRICNNILYLLSPTEQQALINQTYRVVYKMNYDYLDELRLKNDDLIFELLMQTHDIHGYFLDIYTIIGKVYNIDNKIDKDINKNRDNKIIKHKKNQYIDLTNVVKNKTDVILLYNLIGYYLNERKFLKLSIINSEMIYLLMDGYYKDINIEISYKVNKFLKNNMDNYLKRLELVIYKALNDNDYF